MKVALLKSGYVYWREGMPIWWDKDSSKIMVGGEGCDSLKDVREILRELSA
jgi:hypothetical protein